MPNNTGKKFRTQGILSWLERGNPVCILWITTMPSKYQVLLFPDSYTPRMHQSHLPTSLSHPESSLHMPTESQVDAAVANRLSQLSLEAHSGARGDGGVNATGFQVAFLLKSRNDADNYCSVDIYLVLMTCKWKLLSAAQSPIYFTKLACSIEDLPHIYQY